MYWFKQMSLKILEMVSLALFVCLTITVLTEGDGHFTGKELWWMAVAAVIFLSWYLCAVYWSWKSNVLKWRKW